MKSGITIGAGAGFVGGLAAALALWILGIKGHEGQMTHAIVLVSPTVGSGSFLVGALIQVAVATVLGALFGVCTKPPGSAASRWPSGRRSMPSCGGSWAGSR